MEIVTGTLPEWDDADDRALWFQFLQTRTGKRLLPKALEDCPTLLAGGEINALLIRTGEVRGVQMILQALLTLSTGTPKPAESQSDLAYPPLDDDSKWQDGQKVIDPSNNITT